MLDPILHDPPLASALASTLCEAVAKYILQRSFRYISLNEMLEDFPEVLCAVVLQSIDGLAEDGKISLSSVDGDVAIRWRPGAEPPK